MRDDAEPAVYDVPWLHADAPAFMADDGAVILPQCPYCGGRHRHGGFGHRIAHCIERKGRGYVLRPDASVLPIGNNHDRDGSAGGWAQGP